MICYNIHNYTVVQTISDPVLLFYNGVFTMKKIALITDGWERYVTYTWIQGYRRYTAEHPDDIDLYVFHSFGNFNKDQDFNNGEYNIFRLPDLSAFDGILLDLANIKLPSLKEEIITAARNADVPVISLLEEIPGLYFSGINNYDAICQLMDHLINKHNCQTINYVGGPPESSENQERFRAYRESLQKHNIPYDSSRVTSQDYEIHTGLQALEEFKNKNLLPDAFVCANDNIAVGICLAAKEAGYRIPEDFLVTGFDNENKASYFSPRITTIGFSKADIMYNALQLFTRICEHNADSIHTYASVEHVFQESCGCVSRCPANRGQYVANSIMSEVHQSDMQNWMMELDRFLIDCNSFTELAEHLHTWLKEHECGTMCLLMNPDIFLLESIDTLPEIPDDIYLHTGYPEQMVVVYPRSSTDALTLDLSKGTLLPHTDISDKNNIYLFLPVHFREREVGYLILENCDYLLSHQFLFEMLNTFRTSVEALYGRLILRKKNRQLSQLYIHDSLTGFYNRMAYEKLALPLFQQCMQKGRPVGIMFADADHLKYINDSFGHDMGNLAISSIASVIQQQCPVGSISMRYGGDEFVCVIPDYSQSKMQQLKNSILASLEQLSASSHMTFPLEASIGFVVADDPAFSLNDYINLADEKMYAEKKEHKATRQ